ncbi:alpha-L-fucosidase-like [Styela clava]
MLLLKSLLLVCAIASTLQHQEVHKLVQKVSKYDPTWDSLDTRPTPTWYDEAKFGIFIHWGVFSVPSFVDEWFWWYWKGTSPNQKVVNYMNANYPPEFTYADFAKDFTAELYDPDHWADLIQESGAKYVVLTTKHHEGFTNWGSKHSWNWNAVDVGAHKDLVGMLANSIRNRTSVHFGVYHSLFEWFNPVYNQDKDNNFTTRDFVLDKTMPELYELVNNYKPDVIWSDGSNGPDDYWRAAEFIAWLYNDSPVKDSVVVNDRWSSVASCKHGDFWTCQDRYNPGKLQNHKWENCMTIDKYSWGFRREANIQDYLTMEEILKTFVTTIAYGGNMLMNMGPCHDGTLMGIFQERLKQMGSWMKVNGEAVYASSPWRKSQNDTTNPDVWYTTNSGNVYAFLMKWPVDNMVMLGSPAQKSSDAKVEMLGLDTPLIWGSMKPLGIKITLPSLNAAQMPCQWAWVLRLTGFE